jgi:subtilisin family serine protease
MMVGALLLCSALSAAIHPTKLNSLPRRLASTPTDVRSPRDAWYIAQFSETPDFSFLRSHGIAVSPRSYISPTRFCLYLTASQARFLLRLGVASLGEVNDKLIEGDVPVGSAPFLHVDTAPSFDPSQIPGHYYKRSPTHYTVVSPNIDETARSLASLPDVRSVWPGSRPRLHNRLGAGFTQSNTRTLNSNGSFDRFFENMGIDGSGTVVTLWDSYLDTNSTFFYDPDHPVPNNTLVPKHRKVLYNFWHKELAPEYAEHGTHTSGTIAGVAGCLNCTAAQYNGIAPGAKLAFRGWPVDQAEFDYFATDVVKLMDRVNSTITSNSWGSDGTDISLIMSVDEGSLEHPDKLFVFSAGNSGGNYMTIGSPAEAKNVLTVGALNQLQVQNRPEPVRYILVTVFHRSLTTWATLASGSPAVNLTAEDVVATPYIALYNTLNFSEKLSSRIVYVTSISDLELLMTKPLSERPFAAITNVSLSFTGLTFPLLVLDNARTDFWHFVYDQYNRTQGIAIYREYRDVYNADLDDVLDFSSRGPAMSGLIKPEVVGPGAGIISAMSIPNGGPNHDLDPFDFAEMDGTSMSCPNIAGSAALVTNYLRQFYHLNPSSSLVKAVIIGSAELPYSEDPEPDADYGFGIVNLARILPNNKTVFNLIVSDNITIDHRTHLIAKFIVANASADLRVVVSFLDVVTLLDGLVPVFGEMALILESPSGKLYRGNDHPAGNEEHFSTNQRVVVYSSSNVRGEWTIHVIANLVPGLLDSIQFAAIVRGSLNTTTLIFSRTNSCIGCSTGSCDSLTGLCNCPANKFGQSCQTSVENIAPESSKSITVFWSDNLYLSLQKPPGVSGVLNVVINVTDLLSILAYPMIHLFVAEGRPPSEYPRDYDWPDWGIYSWEYTFEGQRDDSVVGGILIHVPLWWSATFTITTQWRTGPATRTLVPVSDHSSEANSVSLLLLITAPSLFVVVLIIVLIVCCRRRRQKVDLESDGRSEQLVTDGQKLVI